MVLLLKKLFKGYFWLINDTRDPRSDGFFLMSSPLLPLLLGVSYLFLIYKVLPEFMKNRTPFKLDRVMIVFNLTQVIVNGFITYEATVELSKMNWYCNPIDFTDTPRNRYIIKICYLYFLTKIADLLDTVFFLLRGKTNQVSFLHVYHHFGMIALSWIGTRYLGGGHSIYLGAVNAFVHTVMYFYYFLTIWKPEYKASIWWKKHITHLQLIQFVFFLFTYGQMLFNPECTYPKVASYVIVPQNIFMMALFGDFYWKAYIRPKKNQKQKQQKKIVWN